MAKPIYFVGGSKGGVGKSIVAMAMVDFLTCSDEQVLLVESDTSNPDVFKAYENEVKSEVCDLETADGWIDLVNLCETNPESCIVINTAARNNQSVTEYGQTLGKALAELERKLITLWVINSQRDSLTLLKEYMDAIPEAVVHVLKNENEGRDFKLFEASRLKMDFAVRGWRALPFPVLASRVSDEFYNNRLSISAAAKAMPLGNRAELARWRSVVKTTLEKCIA